MNEVLSLIFNVLQANIVVGFAMYSILIFIILRQKKEAQWFIEFDIYANELIIQIGIVLALIWCFGQFNMALTKRVNLFEYMSSPYFLPQYFQLSLWFGLTQLLRIPNFRGSLIFRTLFVLPFIFNLERLVILITSFHRDYLNGNGQLSVSNYFHDFPWHLTIIHLFTTMFAFVLLVFLYKILKTALFKLISSID